MRSEWDQRRAGFGGESAGYKDGPVEGTTETLKPTDKIDGRADGGEVQPVGSADIAPQHCAEMQRHAKWQRRESVSRPRLVEMGHPAPRGADRLERGVAGVARRSVGDRKDREHPVAHEFEHFAAERVHGTGDA